MGIILNFCGLLRLFELYGNRPIWLKLTFKGANLIEIQFLINWRPLIDAPLDLEILFLVEKLLFDCYWSFLLRSACYIFDQRGNPKCDN